MIEEQRTPSVIVESAEAGQRGLEESGRSSFGKADSRPPLSGLFVGPGGLRPGWGLLLFFTLMLVFGQLATFVVDRISPQAAMTAEQRRAEAEKPQTPARVITQEGISFAGVAIATWIMSLVERRRFGVYGSGGPRKMARFFAGFAWGLFFLSVLVGALRKAGLLVFDRRLVFGADAFRYGAIWVVGFLLVGLFEEYLLRGYVQYTLSRGMASLYEMLFEVKDGRTLGFWTAAVLLSLLFGAGHGGNPGESPIGLVSAGLIGLIFCLTLWRTGSLWWALGFHASWDWAQSFVFGVADSGTIEEGRLFATHPVGKVLWSGGATGPEGSILVLFVLMFVVAAIVVTLPRRAEWPIDAGRVE